MKKCNVCGKPCFGKICSICMNGKKKQDKAIAYFKSFNVSEIKECVRVRERGDGIIVEVK
jgi:hypothetical protein